MVRYRIDDSTWAKIYVYLKARPKLHTGHEAKSRIFVDAVHWIMRTGAQWRDLPEELGNWNTVFKRFGRWSEKGIWDEVHKHFIAGQIWNGCCLTVPWSERMLAQPVRPTRKVGKKRRHWGRGSVDKNSCHRWCFGEPLRLLLTDGQWSDATQAIALLEGFDFQVVLADRGYFIPLFKHLTEAHGWRFEIYLVSIMNLYGLI